MPASQRHRRRGRGRRCLVPGGQHAGASVVRHLHRDVGVVELESNLDRCRRFRVLEGIGERLLHQPVDGQLGGRGELEGPAGPLERDPQPGCPDAVDERFELGQAGLRRIRRTRTLRLGLDRRPGARAVRATGPPVLGRRSRPGSLTRGRLARSRSPCCGVLAQHAEHPTHIGQGLAAGAGHLGHDIGGPRRVGPRRGGGAIGQGHHHLDVVRDDVVHLTRDACPFRGRRQRRLLVAFAFESLGPFGQQMELTAYGANHDARQQGREGQPGQVDERLEVAARRIPAHGGHDDPGFEHRGADEDPGPGRDGGHGADRDQERGVRWQRLRHEPLRERDRGNHREDRNRRAPAQHQRKRKGGREQQLGLRQVVVEHPPGGDGEDRGGEHQVDVGGVAPVGGAYPFPEPPPVEHPVRVAPVRPGRVGLGPLGGAVGCRHRFRRSRVGGPGSSLTMLGRTTGSKGPRPQTSAPSHAVAPGRFRALPHPQG